MPTIRVPITVPELSEMLLTLLMVNGNTSLRRLRYVHGTCPELSGALTVILLYCLLFKIQSNSYSISSNLNGSVVIG